MRKQQTTDDLKDLRSFPSDEECNTECTEYITPFSSYDEQSNKSGIFIQSSLAFDDSNDEFPAFQEKLDVIDCYENDDNELQVLTRKAVYMEQELDAMFDACFHVLDADADNHDNHHRYQQQEQIIRQQQAELEELRKENSKLVSELDEAKASKLQRVPPQRYPLHRLRASSILTGGKNNHHRRGKRQSLSNMDSCKGSNYEKLQFGLQY